MKNKMALTRLIPMIQPFRKSLIVLVGMLALTGLISLVAPLRGLGQGSSGNAPPTQNVQVVNQPTDPVPVREVDYASRQPVSASVSLIVNEGQDSTDANMFQVPVGKMLVIEYVTARMVLPAGQTVSSMGFTAELNNAGQTVFLQMTHLSASNREWFFASQAVRVYADRSLTGVIEAFVVRDNSTTGSGNLLLTFYGHLVDVP